MCSQKNKESVSHLLRRCIYIPKHLLCSVYMWQKGRERMKQRWKRPLFSFPLKAAFFSSPTHFFPEPVHFKSWPGPVCRVTCLPKGSFQINSSSPWDASPHFTESLSETPSARRSASQRQHTFLNLYFISWYHCWMNFAEYTTHCGKTVW